MTSSQTGTTSAASSSTDLSAGAAAGIGVGAGAVVVLLACGAWLFYRRKMISGRALGPENGSRGTGAAVQQLKPPESGRVRAVPLDGPLFEQYNGAERVHELEPLPPRPSELW